MAAGVRATIAFGLLALAGPIVPALSQPAGSEAVANYTGSDRQAVLEAGARREGSVLV
jgi:hypothetical protein